MTPALAAAEARLATARERLTRATIASDSLDVETIFCGFVMRDSSHAAQVDAVVVELDAATDEHLVALTLLCDERGRELERVWAEARAVRELLSARPSQEVRS